MECSDREYIFLVKSILGQQLDLSEDGYSSDSVIDACIAKADRDMLTAGCSYLKAGMKVQRRKEMKQLLEKYEYSFSRNMIDELSNVISMQKKDGIICTVEYGLAQKLVNMSYKYFYVFRHYIDKKIQFSDCDCPVDSIVLDKIDMDHYIWSRLDAGSYVEVQNKIDVVLPNCQFQTEADKTLYSKVGRMMFDFIVW